MGRVPVETMKVSRGKESDLDLEEQVALAQEEGLWTEDYFRGREHHEARPRASPSPPLRT